jgi:hypothetical protein
MHLIITNETITFIIFKRVISRFKIQNTPRMDKYKMVDSNIILKAKTFYWVINIKRLFIIDKKLDINSRENT